ncbi:MAG: hypothetical protein AAGI11_13435 [Pseudomonadota bacterium]
MDKTTLVHCAAALLISWLGVGCKVIVMSHNVGEVTFDSGNYQCPAPQICELEVSDMFFSETFKGEATHPNYRFKGWLKGPRHFCGGLIDPCALSTKGFSGNEVLMGILESQEQFFLIPEFERIGELEVARLEHPIDERPEVRDASGKVVGSIGYEPGNDWASAIHVRLKGYAKPYSMVVEHDGLSYLLVKSKNDLVYEGESCKASPTPALVLNDQPSAGVFNPTAAEPVVVGPRGQFFILDPIGKPIRKSWVSRWHASTRQCSQEIKEAGGLAPLVPIETGFEFPLMFTDDYGVANLIEFYDTDG